MWIKFITNKKNITFFIIFFSQFYILCQVDALVTLKRFKSVDNIYIESYIKIYSNTITYKNPKNNNLGYNIQITQTLRRDSSIVDVKKYNIKQDLDTLLDIVMDDLIDQKRFYVENNKKYSLEISIEDLFNTKKNITKIYKNIEIYFPINNIAISDIEFIEQFSKSKNDNIFSKSGFDIIPMVEDFFENDYVKTAYYLEIYNTINELDSNGKYIVNQYIENYDNNIKIGDYNNIKRYSSTEIQPILKVWDIEKLPTGNYNIVIQIRDKNNDLLTEKKQRFQRLNLRKSVQIKNLHQQGFFNSFASTISKDSLNENIKCLMPIASELERSTIANQLVNLTEKMKREFIYQFWNNINSNSPKREWESYLKKVKYVQNSFGSRTKKGYNTDRGRIYLKYGMPNSINDKPNTNNSYPYQVWHYYKAGKFNNKTCIFYSPNMIDGDYILLHSDIPGENKDVNWQRTLRKRSSGINNQELRHQNWEQY